MKRTDVFAKRMAWQLVAAFAFLLSVNVVSAQNTLYTANQNAPGYAAYQTYQDYLSGNYVGRPEGKEILQAAREQAILGYNPNMTPQQVSELKERIAYYDEILAIWEEQPQLPTINAILAGWVRTGRQVPGSLSNTDGGTGNNALLEETINKLKA